MARQDKQKANAKFIAAPVQSNALTTHATQQHATGVNHLFKLI